MKQLLLMFLFVLISTQVYGKECKEFIIPELSVAEKSNNQVIEYLDSLKGTVLFSDKNVNGSYCQLHDWYEDKMSSGRFSSRTLAILVIILGASLPIIGIMENIFTDQKFWVAFIGASIVVAQGFSQTFQYEESWRNFTVAKLELERVHREWQLKIVDASMKVDGLALSQIATKEFEKAISKIVTKETTGYFDTLSESAKNLTNQSNGNQ